jgi:hypothetical protein
MVNKAGTEKIYLCALLFFCGKLEIDMEYVSNGLAPEEIKKLEEPYQPHPVLGYS